jgi:hypothetical protein
MGAVRRDFHNVCFKNSEYCMAVAFTAAQRVLVSPELEGHAYPKGVSIYPERDLVEVIRKHRVDLVAFSYSDVSHIEVMSRLLLSWQKAQILSFWLSPIPCSGQQNRQCIVPSALDQGWQDFILYERCSLLDLASHAGTCPCRRAPLWVIERGTQKAPC